MATKAELEDKVAELALQLAERPVLDESIIVKELQDRVQYLEAELEAFAAEDDTVIEVDELIRDTLILVVDALKSRAETMADQGVFDRCTSKLQRLLTDHFPPVEDEERPEKGMDHGPYTSGVGQDGPG